jgi:hypothetical protein
MKNRLRRPIPSEFDLSARTNSAHGSGLAAFRKDGRSRPGSGALVVFGGRQPGVSAAVLRNRSPPPIEIRTISEVTPAQSVVWQLGNQQARWLRTRFVFRLNGRLININLVEDQAQPVGTDLDPRTPIA